jgi:translation initiation factor 4G
VGQGVNSNGLPSGLVFLTTTNASTYTIDSNGGLRHSGSAGEVSSLFAAPSNVQILPQRPNEPNCIYFLRNGRCKYGPTCKFHHPIETASAIDRRRSYSFGIY